MPITSQQMGMPLQEVTILTLKIIRIVSKKKMRCLMTTEVRLIARRAELAVGFTQLFQEFMQQLLVAKGFPCK